MSQSSGMEHDIDHFGFQLFLTPEESKIMEYIDATEYGNRPRFVESSQLPSSTELKVLGDSHDSLQEAGASPAIGRRAERLVAVGGTIQFVCTANVTRSVFMHLALRQLLEEAGIAGIEVRSAGLKATAGAPPHPEVSSWLQSRSVPLEGFVAQQLTTQNIATADLIITATRRQRDQVVRMAPLSSTKTFTILQLNRLIGGDSAPPADGDSGKCFTPVQIARLAASRRGLTSSPGAADDVLDPTGKRSAAFASMFELVQPVLHTLVDHVKPAHHHFHSTGEDQA